MQSDYILFPIRTAGILTNAYVAGTVLGPINGNPSAYNQLMVYVNFTIGSLTDAQIKIEFSHDGTTYFQEAFSAVSAGVSTETLAVHKISATGTYRIAVPIKDNYIKISVIGTGTVTSSSATVTAALGKV